jgi:hypothetical protein
LPRSLRPAPPRPARTTPRQALERERAELGDILQQAEALRAENAALHRRGMRLPGLQEENERLKVRPHGQPRARAARAF